MTRARTVLVVDDEQHIRDVVQYALEREGFGVALAEDGAAALDRHAQGGVDVVVLDVSMPGMDGLETCRRLRGRGRTPVLFLSARGDELDRVLGLELGGDDYLVKPFSPRELVARVRAVLRRAEPDSVDRGTTDTATRRALRHGTIHVDLERHEVRAGTFDIALTATELGVLTALLERPGVVLSRAQLMQRAYAWDNHVTERTIDTHVKRIRAKFRDAAGIDPIATVHGVGYKAC
jgi:two-component system OmpR family response regulator